MYIRLHLVATLWLVEATTADLAAVDQVLADLFEEQDGSDLLYREKRGQVGLQSAASNPSFINPKKLFILVAQLTKAIDNNKIEIRKLQNGLAKVKQTAGAGAKGEKGEPGVRGMTVEHHKECRGFLSL